MFGLHTPKSLGYCMKLALNESLQELGQNIRCTARVSKISYGNLIEMVLQLNEVCTTTFGEKCSSTKFTLRGQQEKMFWRLNTKVFCSILRGIDSMYRVYDLREFLQLYDEVLRFKSIVDSQPQIPQCAAEMCDDPCCICFDRDPDTVLPCMHAFCQICINKWAGLSYTLPSTDHQIINRNPVINSNMSSGEESNACVSKETNRTQCPICRSTYGNTSTSWQIIGGQSPRDHTRQISGIVLRMISRTGRPSDPFSEVDDNGSNDEVFVLTDTQNSLTENL